MNAERRRRTRRQAYEREDREDREDEDMSQTCNTMNKHDVPKHIEDLSHAVLGCAIEVHRQLGPGLLEKLYEDALVYELRHAGLEVSQQMEISVPYKSTVLRGQRLDLIVEKNIIVELKAITQITDLHKAQLLSYLRAAKLPLGLLLNFHTLVLKKGIYRIFNERAVLNPSSRSSSPSRSKTPSSSISTTPSR